MAGYVHEIIVRLVVQQQRVFKYLQYAKIRHLKCLMTLKARGCSVLPAFDLTF